MKCKGCGWENPPENKVCSICGAEIILEDGFKPYPPRKKDRRSFKIIKRKKIIVEKTSLFLKRSKKIIFSTFDIIPIIIFGYIPSLMQFIQKRYKRAKYFFYILLSLIILFLITFKSSFNNFILFLLIIFSVISSFDGVHYYLKKKGFEFKIRNYFGLFLACLSVFFLLYNLFLFAISPLFLIVKVQGNYKYIFEERDRVFVSRLQYKLKEPKIGDIVLIKHPEYGTTIERLFAGPGDLVELENGKIYINGDEIKNELLPLSEIPRFSYSRKLQSDEYFVLIYILYERSGGDLIILNRTMIFGKVKAIISPPERRRFVK